MGQKLASEVDDYITDACPGTLLGRLSFVGHSLGGVIIRAALPYLNQYSGKMHLLLTLSTPHLGTKHNDSWQVKAGFWFIKTFNKKATSLKQISMDDAKNPRETFLYNLSQEKGIGWFKHVVLLGSS